MQELWRKYKLRVLRKNALWRSFRARRQLTALRVQSDEIRQGALLCVMCVRNESVRLPYFLDYYRKMGVDHFLIVDNDSTDGTTEYLMSKADTSVWATSASYKAARFGLDWTTWLQIKYARSKWCLTLDADELLVIPHNGKRSLKDLTHHLDTINQRAFGAIMLDMYPKGPIDSVDYQVGDDPIKTLRWFDAGPYRSSRQLPKENLWVQGGVRERVFFASDPSKGPTLNKLPLVKWDARFAYTNSTHSMLPAKMNHAYSGPGGSEVSGVLLHTKFLQIAVEKSLEDRHRKQHFGNPDAFQDYYDAVIAAPDLWCKDSVEYTGADQLLALKMMSQGDWA
ncbi:glycosyl transferase family 2 [Pacificibacter maritimus]|uniref:Glycosyl transferase family 2 n=1 Tax=Pacificibacter maritimus TaxID=762213 RepID=A0A3N4U8J0_9RHOB|nr:glycosyltransferase family 2 protein [Pacificibacter maritimus]RPE64665.1 glycosyl transferase family 2 [Pacificibacter maritimus]